MTIFNLSECFILVYHSYDTLTLVYDIFAGLVIETNKVRLVPPPTNTL